MSAALLPLPGTGLAVSRLSLGGVPFGNTITAPETFALLDRYVALGGNFIDTACIYSDWIPGEKRRSERILGDWLAARKNRAGLVIATKGAHPDLATPAVPRSSAAEIRADLEGSLRTLRTDVIDLYWLHRDDPARPVEHYIDVLAAFVREGKVRALGASNWTAARLRAANAYAARSGQPGFAASQPLWCLGSHAARPPADPTMVRLTRADYDLHRETGLALVPYTSQAGGFYAKLALPLEQRPADFATNAFHTPPCLAAAAVATDIARQRGISANAVILAYLWSRPFPVMPIVGPRTPAQLDDCWAALPVRLTATELAALEAAAQSGLPAET